MYSLYCALCSANMDLYCFWAAQTYHRQLILSSCVFIFAPSLGRGLDSSLSGGDGSCAATHTKGTVYVCVCVHVAWHCSQECLAQMPFPLTTPCCLLISLVTFGRLMPHIPEGIHDNALQLPGSHLQQTCAHFLPGHGQPYLEPINNPISSVLCCLPAFPLSICAWTSHTASQLTFNSSFCSACAGILPYL